MCTASHNPKAYTGAKLVRDGRDRAVRRHRASRTSARMIDDGPRRPARRRLGRGGRHLRRTSSAPRCSSSTRPTIKPLKVVVDGGNGMAGPMVGPLLDQLGLDLVTTYWTPDGEFPDHEPNPLLPENRQFIIDKVLAEGADLGIAWDGDADRCFFIDDTGAFVDGDFLTALLAESPAREAAGRGHPLRRARVARGARHRRRGSAAPRTSTASATRSSRRACATRAASFGGEVSGHYYFRRLLQRRLRHDPGAADPRAALDARRDADRAARAAARPATSSPARSTPRSPTPRPRWRRSRRGTATARSPTLDGVSVDYDDWHFNVRPSNTEPLLRLSLESLVSPGGHGAPARRGARDRRSASMSARTASTASRSPRRSPSGASTAT